jgi:multiple sugar transport system permease protein
VQTRRHGAFGIAWLSQSRWEAIAGYLFIGPWLLGLFLWTLGPMAVSAVLSTFDTDLLSTMTYVGFKNYADLAKDPLFWKSLANTAYYVAGTVTIGMVASLALALAMNVAIRGIKLFRTIYYLPAVLPAAPVAILWAQVFNPQVGLANAVIGWFGIPPQQWLFSEVEAMPCLIIMGLWGIGSGLMIYLAGLQGIQRDLYEAASVDGAGRWARLWGITLPMLSPTIFFNLVLSVIGSFLVFTQSFVMTGGGPNYATLTYVLYLYQQGFKFFAFGYASAMAWVLFFIVVILAAIVFRSAPFWVHYESDLR